MTEIENVLNSHLQTYLSDETFCESLTPENHSTVDLNTGDICTRECSVGILKRCLLWWNGPEFLLGGKEMWPSQEFLLPKNVDLEEKRNGESGSSVDVSSCGSKVGVGKVIDCGRFSFLKKLVRVTEFVLRYLHNLKACLSQCKVKKGICCLKK